MSITLSTFICRCDGIGSRDFDVLMSNLKENATLVELNLSHNGLAQSHTFTELLAAWLGVSCCLFGYGVSCCLFGYG